MLTDEQKHTAFSQMLRALPGYPWLPCPICRGVEGCDHIVAERALTAIPGLRFEPAQ